MFGALGVVLMFWFGRTVTGSTVSALAAALLIGGCAGYWFFSATIDTYVPNLCASILALGLALRCLRDQRVVSYAALGAAMGVAFLFRTDAFLLAVLALVILPCRAPWPRRLAACAMTGALVGGLGYALLAHGFYNVPFGHVTSWALGHEGRPEVVNKQWGIAKNVTGAYVSLTAANHAVYGVLLPGLYGTHNAHVWDAMSKVKGAWPGFLAYALFGVLLALVAARRIARAIAARAAAPDRPRRSLVRYADAVLHMVGPPRPVPVREPEPAGPMADGAASHGPG